MFAGRQAVAQRQAGQCDGSTARKCGVAIGVIATDVATAAFATTQSGLGDKACGDGCVLDDRITGACRRNVLQRLQCLAQAFVVTLNADMS